MASDYVTLVFLRPVLARLTHEAPGVRLHITRVSSDLDTQLRRSLIDLVIAPRAVLQRFLTFPSSPLFSDRYVCVVSGDHPDIGDQITAEEFSSLPYVAYHADPLESVAEQQLDAAGVTRNVEISLQSFLAAPYLLGGTQLVSLVHERLARTVQEHLDLRLLEPPFDLDPITQVMTWSRHQDHDPGLTWLRGRLQDQAGQL